MGAFAVSKDVIQAKAGFARNTTHAGYNNSTFRAGLDFYPCGGDC